MATEAKTDAENTNQDDSSKAADGDTNPGKTETGADAGSSAQQGNENPDGKTGDTNAEGETTYEFVSPEGVQVNPEVTAHFEGLAKKHGLTKEAAEGIYSETSKLIADLGVKQLDTLRAEWHDQTVNDAELGGSNLGANLAFAKTALSTYFSPEFSTLLAQTGLENHPELIRGLVKVGKDIGEDRLPGGSGKTSAATKSPEQILFDGK